MVNNMTPYTDTVRQYQVKSTKALLCKILRVLSKLNN